ncbi:hypothetical protein BF49_3615 [Bradyrhizobium sp.]|nr:hypothetical protein BF49_3615 [Bradyrhizobium sp.]
MNYRKALQHRSEHMTLIDDRPTVDEQAVFKLGRWLIDRRRERDGF